jgi:3-oxoacyl-[acyl-carrier protein] reductase
VVQIVKLLAEGLGVRSTAKVGGVDPHTVLKGLTGSAAQFTLLYKIRIIILIMNLKTDSNPFSLAGRVALVTGSSAGLGKAMAMALGQAGAAVAFNYQNNQARAEKTFADFQAQGCHGALVRGDVTSEVEVPRLVNEVAERLGPVDILVVNATCDQPHRPIEEYDWALYQAMVDFFIKSPFLLTRACLPHMKRQKWGRIINIGSEVVERAVAYFSVYVTAKAGQNGFHRSLASELAPFGINVNMICPGWIPVERHANDPQSEKDAYRASIPANRWGVPEDVGGAAVFLASDASSFITGQSLHVNGGLTVN